MGFYVANADATGAIITASQLLLNPGPSFLDYPEGALGTRVETEGTVIFQQPTLDNRVRSWIWQGYPANQVGFQNVWPQLEALRSATRVAMGFSPYTFLMETTSNLFRQLTITTGSGSGSGFTFTVSGGGLTVNQFAGGFITCVGQTRSITTNDATTIHVPFAWNGSISGTFTVQYPTYNFYRVRVLDVSRRLDDKASVTRYSDARISFVVDDPASSSLVG